MSGIEFNIKCKNCVRKSEKVYYGEVSSFQGCPDCYHVYYGYVVALSLLSCIGLVVCSQLYSPCPLWFHYVYKLKTLHCIEGLSYFPVAKPRYSTS